MAVAQGSGSSSHGDSNRMFVRSVFASIVVHALVLVALPGWFDTAKGKAFAPPPLIARLVQQQPAPIPLPEPEPKRQDPAEPPRKSVPLERSRPIPAAPPVPSLALAAAPAPAPDAPGLSESAQPVVPSVVATIPTRGEPAPAPPAAAPVAGDAADPGTLGQYRIAIISAAKRYKRYPRLALDNNWEGQAEIRMLIGADGGIASISIRSRSGFEVLDQQALEMIRKAKALAPIPPALRGKAFTIDVPVVFSLKEETG